MIYITGDTHADFTRFSTKNFPEQKEMTRDDYVIVCGDFGGIWSFGKSTKEETYWMDWLYAKPFTLLFVDGNHENFDRLNQFPVVNFYRGKAHKIRNNIYHLMRGYVFNLQGKSFFAFGGASSHDIQDGILDPNDYKSARELVADYKYRTLKGEMLRINHVSWWDRELPDQTEMGRGFRELNKVNNNVDFVISHSLPQTVCGALGYTKPDTVTRYFDDLLEAGLTFGDWFSGHYHKETDVGRYHIRYHSIERIV